jgi:hypothetical protein
VTGTGGASVPTGYRQLRVRDAVGVAQSAVADAVELALADNASLLEYAAKHPERRAFMGRGVAWSVPLPSGIARVVVRRSRHGGFLAPVTGERFLLPTRAPHELETALRLRKMGIPTPEVLAYVLYPAGPLLRRFDMATREVPGGEDLPAALQRMRSGPDRERAIAAAGTLMTALARHGVRHPDLNLKNVLVTREGSEFVAYLLDVDRVRFRSPGSAGVERANRARMARSAKRWRERGLVLKSGELDRLAGSSVIADGQQS